MRSIHVIRSVYSTYARMSDKLLKLGNLWDHKIRHMLTNDPHSTLAIMRTDKAMLHEIQSPVGDPRLKREFLSFVVGEENVNQELMSKCKVRVVEDITEPYTIEIQTKNSNAIVHLALSHGCIRVVEDGMGGPIMVMGSGSIGAGRQFYLVDDTRVLVSKNLPERYEHRALGNTVADVQRAMPVFPNAIYIKVAYSSEPVMFRIPDTLREDGIDARYMIDQMLNAFRVMYADVYASDLPLDSMRRYMNSRINNLPPVLTDDGQRLSSGFVRAYSDLVDECLVETEAWMYDGYDGPRVFETWAEAKGYKEGKRMTLVTFTWLNG